MAKVSEILSFVETLAPASMAESWDNNGLLCGRMEQEVKTILVALDPFAGVIAEAIDEQADLILTHHPIIFDEPIKALNDETEVGRNLLNLSQHHIAAINAHTSLDQAPGGVNDCLAEKLGLGSVRVINPQGVDGHGRQWGLLRQGVVPEQPLSQFLAAVKTALGCPGLRYVSGGKSVCKVAVGGGACADEMLEAVNAGCDTFVTSDVKYNGFWDAHDLGLNLIDAGHFYTENPVVSYLAAKVAEAFPAVRVLVSKTHGDVMRFF